MRLVQQNKEKPEVVEIAWMWLPTFIGQNTALLKDVDKAISQMFPPPVEATYENLDEMHKFVIAYLCERLKITNLDKYLKAIWWVGDDQTWSEKTVVPKGV